MEPSNSIESSSSSTSGTHRVYSIESKSISGSLGASGNSWTAASNRYPSIKPGFIRIKLIELDPPPDSIIIQGTVSAIQIEPYCMVNIKEMVKRTSKKKKKHKDKKYDSEYKLVQTKPSFYPNWNSCFDCHLYEGRMIQIVIKTNKSDDTVAEATVSAESLANKTKQKLVQQDWV